MTPLFSCFCVCWFVFGQTWHLTHCTVPPRGNLARSWILFAPSIERDLAEKNLFNLFILFFLLLFITFWLFVCSDLTWLGQPPLSSWLSTNQSAPSRNCRRCSCSDIHTFCTWAYVVAEGLYLISVIIELQLEKIACCLSTCPCPAKISLVTLNLARFLDPFNKPPLQTKCWGKRCLPSFTRSFISKGKCFDGKMRETKLGLTCQDQWGCPWSSWSIVQKERCPSHTQPWTVFGSGYLLSCNSFRLLNFNCHLISINHKVIPLIKAVLETDLKYSVKVSFFFKI